MKVMHLAVPSITFKITQIHTGTYFPFMPIKSSKTNKAEVSENENKELEQSPVGEDTADPGGRAV